MYRKADHFVRYADNCNIFVRSDKSVNRVFIVARKKTFLKGQRN